MKYAIQVCQLKANGSNRYISPSILTTLLLTLFKSTQRFSKTLAATPSPSLIRPNNKCSVPIYSEVCFLSSTLLPI